jgi:hypothetical protein
MAPRVPSSGGEDFGTCIFSGFFQAVHVRNSQVSVVLYRLAIFFVLIAHRGRIFAPGESFFSRIMGVAKNKDYLLIRVEIVDLVSDDDVRFAKGRACLQKNISTPHMCRASPVAAARHVRRHEHGADDVRA